MPGLIEKASAELEVALEGYSCSQVANFDESKILLNYVGKKSIMPKRGLGCREINKLDDKKSVTIGQPLKQDGTLTFHPLIIDENIPTDIATQLKQKFHKYRDNGKHRDELLIHTTKNFYLAITPTHFMNRTIFYQYFSRMNEWLKTKEERLVMLLDNLACHYLSLDEKKKWQKENPGKICYVDSHSFSQIKMVYLPPNVTATSQPADLGFYCTIQNKYKTWFNRLGDKKSKVLRGAKILKIADLFKEVSAAVLSNCWAQSAITALNPKEPLSLAADEVIDLENAYAEFYTLNFGTDTENPDGKSPTDSTEIEEPTPGPSGI